MSIDLSLRREQLLKIFESRKDTGGPPGCYRWLPGSRTNLYASLDTAIAYAVMGIDRNDIDEPRRLGWIEHINSYIDDYRNDGTYKDVIPRHSPSHANGMVIGALGYLGGRQLLPVDFYKDFNTPAKAVSWLENLNWPTQWASGFWGGPMMYSTGCKCSKQWIDTVIGWLTDNLDPATGMWRKGITPVNVYQPLGGFVHIYPIYELHDKPFPYTDQVIDYVLSMQSDNGRWFDGDSFSYFDMDCLYAYVAMLRVSDKRADAAKMSALRYYSFLEETLAQKDVYDTITTHGLLCLASTYGLLYQLLPDVFVDSVAWTDIFSARLLYQTSLVEAV